jgi:hypothetical protein
MGVVPGGIPPKAVEGHRTPKGRIFGVRQPSAAFSPKQLGDSPIVVLLVILLLILILSPHPTSRSRSRVRSRVRVRGGVAVGVGLRWTHHRVPDLWRWGCAWGISPKAVEGHRAPKGRIFGVRQASAAFSPPATRQFTRRRLARDLALNPNPNLPPRHPMRGSNPLKSELRTGIGQR